MLLVLGYCNFQLNAREYFLNALQYVKNKNNYEIEFTTNLSMY